MKRVAQDVKFVEVQNVDNMEEKIDRLGELLSEVYQAEEMLDGVYSSDEFEDVDEINEFYEYTLNTLSNFMAMIRTRVKHEEEKILRK